MNIKEILDKTELLAQLAEESAELSQAALKLRRAIDGKNPTPKSIPDCMADLNEEIADVWLCLCELENIGIGDGPMQSEFMTAKRKRWLTRLLERHGEA